MDLSGVDDTALVSRAKAGDFEAFEELVCRPELPKTRPLCF